MRRWRPVVSFGIVTNESSLKLNPRFFLIKEIVQNSPVPTILTEHKRLAILNSLRRMGLHVGNYVIYPRLNHRHSNSWVIFTLKAVTVFQCKCCHCQKCIFTQIRRSKEKTNNASMASRESFKCSFCLHKSKIQEESKLRTCSWKLYHMKVPSYSLAL